MGGFIFFDGEGGSRWRTCEGSFGLHYLVGAYMEGGVLTAYTFAQEGLTIHFDSFHGEIDQQVGLQSRSCYANTHIGPNLGLCTGCFPNPNLVQTAQPPVVGVGMSKLKVAKGHKARISLGGDGTLLGSVDIKCKRTTVYNDSYVVPLLGSSENIGDIQAVGTVTLPPYGKTSIAIVMEEELAPARTDLM